jgi:hypothetical protein
VKVDYALKDSVEDAEWAAGGGIGRVGLTAGESGALEVDRAPRELGVMKGNSAVGKGGVMKVAAVC